MPTGKGYDNSRMYGGKDRYSGKGGSKKVMKNHGNTSSINTDSEKFDMGRLQMRPHEYKGYSDRAFDYKY